MRLRNQKKHVRVQLHPSPNLTLLQWPPNLACGVCSGCNQICQISTKLFEGLWNLGGGRKCPFSIDLAHHPYKSVSTNIVQYDMNVRDDIVKCVTE